jgi:fucose permease
MEKMQWRKHGHSNAAENHSIFIRCMAIIGNGVVVLNTTALSFVLTQKKQKVKQEHITPMFLQTP